jgi:hypothetical protein
MSGGVTSRWQRQPRSIRTVSTAESSLGSRTIRGASDGSARMPAGRLRTAPGSDRRGAPARSVSGTRRGAERTSRLGGRGRSAGAGGRGRIGSHHRMRGGAGRGRGVRRVVVSAGRTRCTTTTLRTSGLGGGTGRSPEGGGHEFLARGGGVQGESRATPRQVRPVMREGQWHRRNVTRFCAAGPSCDERNVTSTTGFRDERIVPPALLGGPLRSGRHQARAAVTNR